MNPTAIEAPNNFLDVRAFHVKFGQPTDVDDNGLTRPVSILPRDQFLFRKRFLFEEADEYAVAYNKRNLVSCVDSLIDLVYVTYGTALFMGAGAGFFTRQAWPTFTQVQAAGVLYGYLAGRPREPHFLDQKMHEVFHHMLQNQIKLFEMVHESGDRGAVPLAMCALWDLAYGAMMTAAMMSAPWEACWAHVQNANMAKERARPDGSNSARQSGWDVVKPTGWTPPDVMIKQELILAGAKL